MTSRGISNFRIQNAIANIGDDDLTNNFVDVFPSNYMNKFIDHAPLMKGKKREIPFYHG